MPIIHLILIVTKLFLNASIPIITIIVLIAIMLEGATCLRLFPDVTQCTTRALTSTTYELSESVGLVLKCGSVWGCLLNSRIHIRNPNKGPRFLNQVPTLHATCYWQRRRGGPSFVLHSAGCLIVTVLGVVSTLQMKQDSDDCFRG